MLGPYNMSLTGVERSGGGYFRIPPAVGFSSSKNLPRQTVRMRGSRGRAGSHGGATTATLTGGMRQWRNKSFSVDFDQERGKRWKL
jgi:hypothetical protein